MLRHLKPVLVGSLSALIVGGGLIVRADTSSSDPSITPSPTAEVSPTPLPSDTPMPSPTATATPDPTPSVTSSPLVSPIPTPTPSPTATPSPYLSYLGSKWSFEYPLSDKVPGESLIAGTSRSYSIIEAPSSYLTVQEYLTKGGNDPAGISGYAETSVAGQDAYQENGKLLTVLIYNGEAITVEGRDGNSTSSWVSDDTADPDYAHLLQTFSLK